MQAGATVAYDVFDRPWTKMRAYFASFGWDVAPLEEEGRLIPIQALPHFIERMEGVSHLLEWIPFAIRPDGIHLLRRAR